MNKITSDRFGDSKKFPVLQSIVEILNEGASKSEVKFIYKFTENMNKKYKAIELLNKSDKQYFYDLLCREFKQRCDLAFKQKFILNKKLHSHLRNYIIGFYREQLKNGNN